MLLHPPPPPPQQTLHFRQTLRGPHNACPRRRVCVPTRNLRAQIPHTSLLLPATNLCSVCASQCRVTCATSSTSSSTPFSTQPRPSCTPSNRPQFSRQNLHPSTSPLSPLRMSSNDPEAIDALFSTLAFVFKFLVKQIVMNFQARFARACRKSLQSTGTKIITQSCSSVCSIHT